MPVEAEDPPPDISLFVEGDDVDMLLADDDKDEEGDEVVDDADDVTKGQSTEKEPTEEESGDEDADDEGVVSAAVMT